MIVVVDDPVSSLDTKALNYACALVRGRLNGAGQLFVLTHTIAMHERVSQGMKRAWRTSRREGPDSDISLHRHCKIKEDGIISGRFWKLFICTLVRRPVPEPVLRGRVPRFRAKP